MAKLTDRIEFSGTPVNNDVIHIVDVSDTTDSPEGTSFKMTLSKLSEYSGFTNNFWSAGTGTNAIVAKEFNPTSSVGDFSINAGLQSSTSGFASAVLGGQGNISNGDLSSVIAGADNNIDSGSSYSLIVIGEENLISGGTAGFIGASAQCEIKGGEAGTILSSRISEMKGEYSLLTGEANTIESSARGSAILGGFNSTLAANYATIFGGSNHEITSNSTGSAILAGGVNKINGTSSAIIGGLSNRVSGTSNSSVVIAGSNNKIFSDTSSIIAGTNNTLTSTANRSVVLGGTNLTGESSDTVYVSKLNINNAPYYADDASAGVGGLVSGDIFQTDGSGAAPLNVAGILMIKQ